jgi:hypothetical protein
MRVLGCTRYSLKNYFSTGTRKCCGSGIFYQGSGDHFIIPEPVSGSEHFFIAGPGSYINGGMKNKTYRYLFLAIYGFHMQVLVVLIDITNEKMNLKKMKDYLTKKCADQGFEIPENIHPVFESRIQGSKKHRMSGSGSATLVPGTGSLYKKTATQKIERFLTKSR